MIFLSTWNIELFRCLFLIVISVTATIQLSTESGNASNEKWIEHVHNKRGHYVRCKICMKYPDIVKLHSYNNQIPLIATDEGARFRTTVLEHHFVQNYHKDCVKADRIKTLQLPTPALMPLDVSMNKANKEMANYVGKLLIQICADAKRLTLSAWNWPLRYVASEASHAFSIENGNRSTIPKNLSLQYINPRAHLELMSCIVEADISAMKTKIDKCLALSLRIDGSIDRTHIDKIYVLAKVVTSSGATELLFFGVKDQVERFAEGLLKTALGAMEDQFGREFVYDVILKKVSSICTDGTNVNSGNRGGIWKFLEEEISQNGSEIPLMKIWCAAHRADLAFEDLTTAVPETNRILTVLSRIASHFHTSAVRTSELTEIASTIGLKLLSMPKIFEVRFTQYTFQLVRAISANWRAIEIYFRKNMDATTQGFHTFLTNGENLKKMTFLGDLLFIFKRLQKKLQSDSLTLIKMAANVKHAISTLENLKVQSIPTGFESKLQTKLVTRDEKEFLNDVELSTGTTLRHKKATVDEFRETVIDCLVNFLRIRFEAENRELLSVLQAFLEFDGPEATVVSRAHEFVGKDLDMASLYIQFSDMCEAKDVKKLPLHKIVQHLASPEQFVHFWELATVLARILACTPHSADVERCISANNLLKTSLRSKLALTTENQYLYIYFNMTELENWNPMSAIKKWISATRRNRTNTTETSTTKRQKYFKGGFENCNDDSDESDSEIEMKFNLF